MGLIILDGTSLTPESLVQLSHGSDHIDLSREAWSQVREARAVVDAIIEKGEVAYGINTGALTSPHR